MPQRAWELLRKEARKLESEIDSKLASYAKYDKGLSYHTGSGSDGGSSNIQAAEIDDLLSKLSRTNEEMVSSISGSDSRKHTLARHKDILQEYHQEFKRLKSIHSSMQDRADLLGGDIESGAPLLPLSSNSSALLRERGQIGSVNNALDDVIGQAQNVASSLMQQRRMFDGINSKLNMLGARFPAVNSLLTSIRRRKAKDTIVMSLVVAFCLVVMILYVFR